MHRGWNTNHVSNEMLEMIISSITASRSLADCHFSSLTPHPPTHFARALPLSLSVVLTLSVSLCHSVSLSLCLSLCLSLSLHQRATGFLQRRP